MGRRTDHPTNPDVNLVSGAFWGRDPHDELAWLRRNAPVYFDENAGAWGISCYADLKEVSTRPDDFSSAQGIRADAPAMPMMIDMDDPEHWARRKLVNRGFTPRRVRAQEERVREVCDGIIDQICERGQGDLVWDIAAPLPLIMIGDALGVAPEDRDRLLRWSDDLVRGLVGLDGDLEALTNAATAFEEYTSYAHEVIAARRKEPRDDLMTVLVRAEVDGDRLDDESIVQESLLILVGGDETTRHVISGGVLELLRHRAQWDDLRDDRELMAPAVEEMLRWVSPIKNMNRTATRDVEFRGQTIAEGDPVLLLYPSANRDEAVFDDPFRFDIRRDPNEHVAFGFGPHFCLGSSLARLELRTMVDRLLERLPDMRPADEILDDGRIDDRALERRPANFVSGHERIPVAFTPTTPVG
jgi:cholest-4-en-3-one 26-monooxygenase